jgi:uncharacterized protein YkwD
VREQNRGFSFASLASRAAAAHPSGRAVVAGVALVALLGVPASAGARPARSARDACPGAYAPALTLTSDRASHATLCLINHIRRGHGLPALRPLRSLRRPAAGFANSMVQLGFFNHVSPDGRDLVSRLRGSGFIRRDVYWTVGENLGWGVGDAARPVEIVRGWMHSGPHRRNLLARCFRRVGIGVDVGVPAASAAASAKAQGGATYVVDFGVRRRP